MDRLKEIVMPLSEPLGNHPAADNSVVFALENHKIVFHDVTPLYKV